MTYSFNITDYDFCGFGGISTEEFNRALNEGTSLDYYGKCPKPKKIPMLMARRLSDGSRMAVDLGLILNARNQNIDAVVYASRFGEIEHNYKILKSQASDEEASPTDFSMSVHNCAVGNFTILSKKSITSTSISAGHDSFMQALYEAYLMLMDGYRKILLVDFEVTLPPFYKDYLHENYNDYPYAVGLVIESGDMFMATSEPNLSYENNQDQALRQKKGEPKLAPSLQFLHLMMNNATKITLKGSYLTYIYSREKACQY